MNVLRTLLGNVTPAVAIIALVILRVASSLVSWLVRELFVPILVILLIWAAIHYGRTYWNAAKNSRSSF